MDDQIKTTDRKFTCQECKNVVELDEGKNAGDVVECPLCGIEYEIVEANDGEYTLRIIEEEK